MSSFSMLINVGMNAAGVQTGLAKIHGMVGGWAGRAAGSLQGKFAAAFGAGAILEASRRAISYADDLDTLAQRLGVTTDSLQEFGFAAKVNNAEMSDFVGAIEKLNTAKLKALQNPGGSESNSFSGVGISPDDLKSKRGDELLGQIGKAFQKFDPQKIIGDARAVAGKSIGKLVPSLIEGLDVSAAAARRLGIVVNTKTIKGLANMSDQMDIVGMMLKANLIPVLSSVIGAMMRIYFWLLQWHPLARAANIVGALSGGASLSDAFKIDRENTHDNATFMDRMQAELEDGIKRREELLKKFQDESFEVPIEEKEKNAKKGVSENSNAFTIRTENQRVGAFVNPIAFAIQKEQVTILTKIEKNTRKRPQPVDEDIYE